MKLLIYLQILFYVPLTSLSQMDTACERLFIKCETLADFKNGKNAFQDTLTSYLNRNNVYIENGFEVFELTVTVLGEVQNIHQIYGELENSEQIKEALRAIPNMWIPGRQNGHIVCSSINLRIDIVNKKINVSRTQ